MGPTAQVGVQPTGLKPYFLNSFLMVVPAVLISAVIGAFNGYILTQFRLRGAQVIFALLLFSVFIPFQIVLIPMARTLGILGIASSTPGLILVHVVYGLCFTTLYFRNFYAAFPTDLVKAAKIDGAGFFTIFWRIMLPNSLPILVVTVIWQFTNIWNDFLFGASFAAGGAAPITVALNLIESSRICASAEDSVEPSVPPIGKFLQSASTSDAQTSRHMRRRLFTYCISARTDLGSRGLPLRALSACLTARSTNFS